MHLFLEIVEGPGMVGRSTWLQSGDLCRFGSAPHNDLQLLDSGVAAKAGTLVFSSARATLFASHGVSIRGRAVGPAEALRLDDSFKAGPFTIQLRAYPAPLIAAACTTPLGALIAWMRKVQGNLYGVLDAARSPLVLTLIKQSGLRHLSLFDGDLRVRMADTAPYLVAIPIDSPACELLVRASWGRGWATFLASRLEFFETRSQLRRSLIAKLPSGENSYFRFFDPAVLQAFLPSMTAKELAEFCGGISEFIVEQREWPDLALRFYVPVASKEQKRIEIHPLTEIGEGDPIYERDA